MIPLVLIRKYLLSRSASSFKTNCSKANGFCDISEITEIVGMYALTELLKRCQKLLYKGFGLRLLFFVAMEGTFRLLFLTSPAFLAAYWYPLPSTTYLRSE